MRAFNATFAEQNAIVGDNANRIPQDVRKPGHKRRTVAGFEFIKLTAVDNARDDLANVDLPSQVRRHDAVQLNGVVTWLAGWQYVPRGVLGGWHIGEDAASDRQRVEVIFGKVIGDTRNARVDIGTA